MRTHQLVVSCVLALAITDQASAQDRAGSVLPGADSSVCEFVSLNVGAETGVPEQLDKFAQTHSFRDMLVKRAAADIDGDGDVELLDYKVYPAGESAIAYGLRDGYGWKNEPPDGVDPREDVRWAGGNRWFFFRDAWRLATFKDRALTLAVAVETYGKDAATFDCKFNADYTEEILPSLSGAIDAFYADLRSRDGDRRPQGKGRPLTESDIRYIEKLPGEFKYSQGRLSGTDHYRRIKIESGSGLFLADMDGDGTKERFAKLTLDASDSTPSCFSTFFELLPQDGADAPDRDQQKLWRDLQGGTFSSGGRYPASCGQSYEVVEIENRGYVYVVEADHFTTDRRLMQLVQPANVLIPVKMSRFTAHHEIVFDRERGGLVATAPK